MKSDVLVFDLVCAIPAGCCLCRRPEGDGDGGGGMVYVQLLAPVHEDTFKSNDG